MSAIRPANTDTIVARIGHGNLHVDVGAPGRDGPRLARHFIEVIGKDLERNGSIGNRGQNLAPERLVIGHPGLSCETRVGRETLHQRIAAQLHDTVEISTISKNLDPELT